MNTLILSLALSFVLRQVKKFGREVDWSIVKSDANERICKLIPGEMFDAAACDVAERAIDAAAEFLSNDKLDEVVTDLLNGKVVEAFEALLAFVKEKVGL